MLAGRARSRRYRRALEPLERLEPLVGAPDARRQSPPLPPLATIGRVAPTYRVRGAPLPAASRVAAARGNAEVGGRANGRRRLGATSGRERARRGRRPSERANERAASGELESPRRDETSFTICPLSAVAAFPRRQPLLPSRRQQQQDKQQQQQQQDNNNNKTTTLIRALSSKPTVELRVSLALHTSEHPAERPRSSNGAGSWTERRHYASSGCNYADVLQLRGRRALATRFRRLATRRIM